MFRFSKQRKEEKKNSLDAKDILSSKESEATDEMIETELSISPNWNISNEDRYVYTFHNNQSPKLKANQISIYGIELEKLKSNGLIATALIKNTVKKSVHFDKTTILLLDGDKDIIAKKEFDLKQLGDIPSNNARPWRFMFNENDLIAKGTEIDTASWSLAFEIKKKHRLDLEESWEKSIAEKTKASLEEIVANAAPLKSGEVNFMGIQAEHKDNGELSVTILIRNGSDKDISLQQIPLGFKDASGEQIAKGGFKLKEFKVKANTSKPWTFVFPSENVKKENIDLSTWQVYPIQ
ncbi:accessory Sec system S-layer assembly protein [Oceanobacillus damuensis]|uniref:accessory Sec system S-layer assembly protein n=1 Tax=Oceanobacillus damuensis TaxID=937928 RepID=UPI000832CCFE|nr:accessory Sec system S-layer assembly protein [Oceanobacillus damuensis]